MKPASYDGGGHVNMHKIAKWGESCGRSRSGGDGVRRIRTKHAGAATAARHRYPAHRARQAAKQSIRHEVE